MFVMDSSQELNVIFDDIFGDTRRTALYKTALMELSKENPKWVSNFVRYRKWDEETRLWWIEYLDKNIETMEIAQLLSAKVFVLRAQNGVTL